MPLNPPINFPRNKKQTLSQRYFQNPATAFLLRESSSSWERLLLLILQREHSADHLKLFTVDGNAGLISTLGSLLPGVTIQRLLSTKLEILWANAPAAYVALFRLRPSESFMPPAQAEARERFNELTYGGNKNCHRLLNV